MSGNTVTLEKQQVLLLVQEGIQLILSRWTALSVTMEFHLDHVTRQARFAELVSLVGEFFLAHSGEIQPYELADNFLDWFDEVLETDIDDGSERQVSADLVQMWQEIVVHGRYELLSALRLKAAQTPRASHLSGGRSQLVDLLDEGSEGESGDEGESMMDEDQGTPQPPYTAPSQPAEPIVDEDGFQLVMPKRKQRGAGPKR